jgi:hypothetical protein
MNVELMGIQAINLLVEVQALLVQAYGPKLDGPKRGELANGYYLARIRDLLAGIETHRQPEVCASCIDLRVRLVNIYHLTLNYHDAPSAIAAVRAASSPGAPAPAPRSSDA